MRIEGWQTPQELERVLLDVLTDELGLSDDADELGFEASIGGGEYNGIAYFHLRNHPGAAADRWQLLTPVRTGRQGVAGLNRFVQQRFRAEALKRASGRWRKVPEPAGHESIIYGDKVIATKNQPRRDVWPDGSLGYVANGELGIVTGEFKGKGVTWQPYKLEVEFSSQVGFGYKFRPKEFGDDTDAPLELAYAITVHKAQGSEFGLSILVLPNPCRLLSRELLYTALTRQRNKLVILCQGSVADLKRYAGEGYSEASRRLTNLFGPPVPVEIDGSVVDERHIHRTRRGEAVQSKSEVIIADALDRHRIDYVYEQPLRSPDGLVRWPDFTIDQAATGATYYWEHLGMLTDPAYVRRWKRKLVWYRALGILPIEEGGGRAGTLLTTRDDERGGIDSQAIDQLIGTWFGG